MDVAEKQQKLLRELNVEKALVVFRGKNSLLLKRKGFTATKRMLGYKYYKLTFQNPISIGQVKILARTAEEYTYIGEKEIFTLDKTIVAFYNLFPNNQDQFFEVLKT